MVTLPSWSATLLQQPSPLTPAAAEPALVLRLRAEPGSQVMPAAALANCLALRPGLRLEVSVRLVSEDANRALWSGRYVAGREDLLSLQEAAGEPAARPHVISR